MFLKDWVLGDNDPPYPRAAGPLSVYNRQQYYEFLDFAIQNVRIPLIDFIDLLSLSMNFFNTSAVHQPEN